MHELRRMRPLLGTFVEVGARGPNAAQALDAAFACIAAAQDRWSFQDAGSELSRLNAAGGEPLAVHPATVRLLRLAAALMRRSGGLFNCTVGGALVQQGVLPDHGGPPALPRGCAEDIETGRRWARLGRPVRVTLDGIAKGMAVDEAVVALRQSGATAGWINAGGDLRVFGDMVLPVHRREDDGHMTPLGALRDAAVASSRVPSPGEASDPAFPGCLIGPPEHPPRPGIWTVLARTAWRADALTKVAACAAPADREALVASLGGRLLMQGEHAT